MIRAPREASEDDGVGGLVADLTPMLDVLFILIVFFVLTANSAQLVLDLKLPTEKAPQARTLDKADKIVLGIFNEEGRWTLDGKEIADWPALQAALRALVRDRPKARFVIAGDKRIPLQRFVKALAFLQELGIKDTELVMQPD